MLVKDLLETYMAEQGVHLYKWKKIITRKGKDKSEYQKVHDVFRVADLLKYPEVLEMRCKLGLFTSGVQYVGNTYLEVYVLKDQEEFEQ